MLACGSDKFKIQARKNLTLGGVSKTFGNSYVIDLEY